MPPHRVLPLFAVLAAEGSHDADAAEGFAHSRIDVGAFLMG